MKKNTNSGFTLVEMLVVILIIGLLLGIVSVNMGSSRAKARDASRVSDVGQIQLALQLYYDRCGRYPNAAPLDLTHNSGCPTGISLNTFMSKIPKDPKTGSDYDYVYKNNAAGVPTNFVIHASLEETNAAVTSGYNGTSWTGWSGSLTCSSAAGSLDYCVISN